jgi:pimeloyl-ACP methyl ester carboxylesterase
MDFIEFQNKKIFYQREGKGKPVILLHGFGENSNLWNGQIDSLKENYLVIAPDLPGSGKSEMFDGAVLIKDYADVIKALADEIIFKDDHESQFSLIGHSMGGYITLAFAEKYPELLNSFGLFHSSAFADSDEKKETRKKGIEFITRNGAAAFIKTLAPNLFCEKSKKENPELVARLIEIGQSISPEALIQYYRAMMARPDRTSVLKTFEKPVLLIAGKSDTVVPLEASLEQFKMPLISSVHILQSSGHVGMWEEPETSNRILKNFLENLN